jgi:hypothetical protein
MELSEFKKLYPGKSINDFYRLIKEGDNEKVHIILPKTDIPFNVNFEASPKQLIDIAIDKIVKIDSTILRGPRIKSQKNLFYTLLIIGSALLGPGLHAYFTRKVPENEIRNIYIDNSLGGTLIMHNGKRVHQMNDGSWEYSGSMGALLLMFYLSCLGYLPAIVVYFGLKNLREPFDSDRHKIIITYQNSVVKEYEIGNFSDSETQYYKILRQFEDLNVGKI